MAKKARDKSKLAYNNVDKALTLVGNPVAIDDVEVEIDIEEKPDLDAEGIEMIETADGGMEIGMPDAQPMGEVAFEANLAEVLDEDELSNIASMILGKVEDDKSSRQEWMDTYVDGLELLGLKYETKTEPFTGSTGVIHPILNEAVTQFQSQAYKELLPPNGPVRTQILGEATPETEKQAERIKDFMNYNILHVMPEYDSEFDQMLYYLGMCGSAFKKVYKDPQMARQVSKFVEAKDLLIPFNASDLNSAERVTHQISISENELRKLQVSGFYKDIEVSVGERQSDSVDQEKERLTGLEPTAENEEVTLYECHCYLDLEQFPDVDAKGEATGIKLPYIVTISVDSSEVLSVYRNYSPDDPLKNKKQFFVHYMFTPGLGFYCNGLIHLLGNLSRTATANLRKLIDSGTLANLPSGFKTRGLRIRDDDTPIQPGEWRDVDVVGAELRASLMPLPYKEPSGTLFQLLGFVVQSAEKFVGTTDMGVGNMTNQEIPVGTTIALLERGSRVISAVHKRLYNSLKQELALFADIIAKEPNDYPYQIQGNAPGLKAKDFDGRIDIVPVSNPNIFSMAQRISLAQEQLKLATSNPTMHNMYEAYRRMYSALGVDNIEQVLPPPPQPQPEDPMSENAQAVLATGGTKQLRAFPEQDHDAHISTHVMYMSSMIARANPGVLQVLQVHIFEHIKFKAMMQAQQEIQQMAQQGQQIPPELMANRVAEIETQLMQEYMAKEQEILNVGQQDPLVDIKKQELALKQQEQMQQAMTEEQRLALDKQKLAEQSSIQRDRIDTTEDIANMRAQNALRLRQMQTGGKQ